MIKNAKTVLNQHNSDLVRPFFFFLSRKGKRIGYNALQMAAASTARLRRREAREEVVG